MSIPKDTAEVLLDAAELRAEGNSWAKTAETVGIERDQLRKLIAENASEYNRHARRARQESQFETVMSAIAGLRGLISFVAARLDLANPRPAGTTVTPDIEKREQFYSRLLHSTVSTFVRFYNLFQRKDTKKAVAILQRGQDAVRKLSRSTQDLTEEELQDLKFATMPKNLVQTARNPSESTKVSLGKGFSSVKTAAQPAPASSAKRPKIDPHAVSFDAPPG